MYQSGTLRIPTPRAFVPLLYHKRFLGAHGGRGSGKSHFFAEKIVERSIIQRTRSVMIREVQNSIDQSVKQLIENKIRKFQLQDLFKIKDKWIECPHDGLMIFRGMQHYNAQNIKSLEDYDIAWVEEAQAFSQNSLTLLRPTIRNPGSELWFSWNPKNPDDPVDKMFRGPDRLPPEIATCVRVNWYDNPYFPPDLMIEKEQDKRDPDKYAWVWDGDYDRKSEARVFKNWKVEEFITPKNVRLFFGADWGFSVDPSVLLRGFIIGRKLFFDYEAWAVECEIDDLPALFRTVPESTRWPITADSARPETISYMQRHGFPKIRKAVKGPNSVEDGIEFLKTFDIVIHPRCKNLIREIAKYSWKVDKQTEEVLPQLEDKDNHTIDSARYALEGTRRGRYGMLEVV